MRAAGGLGFDFRWEGLKRTLLTAFDCSTRNPVRFPCSGKGESHERMSEKPLTGVLKSGIPSRNLEAWVTALPSWKCIRKPSPGVSQKAPRNRRISTHISLDIHMYVYV